MKRRVAVVTDATSADYFFPHWVRYYGRLFGRDNLFVVTYKGMREQFRSSDLVNVVEIPCHYSNKVRRVVITDMVRRLLTKFDYVIRCDVDEFIVPDPIVYKNLAEYVDGLKVETVTALGLDVVERRNEPHLRLDSAALLHQRGFAVKAASYSKTCITSKAIGWFYGFHHADVAPAFHHLYLFHMKFSDVRGRVDWLRGLARCCDPDSGEYQHFLRAIDEFERTDALFHKFEIRTGWDAIRDKHFQKCIEASVKPPTEADPFFRFFEGTEEALSEIPSDFRQAF